MGITNEKATAWGTQEKRDVHLDSRRDEDVRGESTGSRYQQERADRANRSKPSIFRSRETIIGGMLRQLTSDYRAQVASKRRDIQFLKTLIQNIEADVHQLESRLVEFEALQNELTEQDQQI